MSNMTQTEIDVMIIAGSHVKTDEWSTGFLSVVPSQCLRYFRRNGFIAAKREFEW